MNETNYLTIKQFLLHKQWEKRISKMQPKKSSDLFENDGVFLDFEPFCLQSKINSLFETNITNDKLVKIVSIINS